MIRIENFTKQYNGLVAVDDLNMEIEEGDIFGFIGPNGAGKTTTIRFLATLLAPTSGDAWINNFSVTEQQHDVKRSIGFMPDVFGVYDGMRVWEFLDFFAMAYGLKKEERKRIIEDVLILLDLQYKRDDLVNGLSRGMKQRLCLARTLVHDPPVLILDEPASGLDPRARIEIKELLKELQRMGKTILISSHILSELADCCNKIGIIEKGKLLATGKVEDILAAVREHHEIQIQLLDRLDDAVRILRDDPHVKSLDTFENNIKVEFDGTATEIAELNAALVSDGIPVLWFKEIETKLEDAFMKITEGKVA